MKLPGVRFSKDALVGFLLDHGEKIVGALIGLLALVLAWNGLSALRLKSVTDDKRPEALVRLTNETVQHIDAEPNPPAEVMRRAGELARTIDPWRPSQVKVAAPPEMATLSRPAVSSITMRGEPKVFPIEDLRAVAGVAMVRDMAAEQAASALAAQPVPEAPGTDAGVSGPDIAEPVKRFEKLVPCVVVVGLVPVAKQREEFRRTLATPVDDPALGPQQADAPRWADFVVERTAVSAGKPEAWMPIRARLVTEQAGSKPLPDRFLLGQENLAQVAGESTFAAGLPPRIDQPWGLDTIHPWFLQPQHKWRFERAEQIAETPVQLGPAEFRRQFLDHAGHEVEIRGVKFAGPAQRTASPETVMVAVASADGSETFPAADPAAGDAASGGAIPAKDLKPVFAMASGWQRTLDMKSLATCNLRVIPTIDGGAAIAQIVGVIPLNADGTPGGEQRDPRAAGTAGPGGGFVPGGEGGMPMPMPGGGGPPLAGGAVDEGAEFRLFRFVDDSVEFGKAYRYRVKTDLVNPNWGFDPKLLANAKSADVEVLSAESAASAPVLVPPPYVALVRDSLDSLAAAGGSPDQDQGETPKATTSKAQQLGRTQVEVSFLGPTWLHMRGKRPEQGYDYFDYRVEHVRPVEPGAPVLWRQPRPAKEKTKAAKGTEKPRASGDPAWQLLSVVDVGRDLVDFRGRQAADGAPADEIPEPVELALLRPDGSLEVVTAAGSQRVFDAFAGGVGGEGMSMPPGMGPGMPRPAGPTRMERPGL